MRKFLATRKASSKVGAPQLLHENTSLHFRAAALPGRLGLLRHAFSHSDSDAKTEIAFKTNRACKAFAESVPHSFRKAHHFPSDQTKIFPVYFRVSLSLFCFLSLCLSKTLPEIHTEAHARPQTRRRTRQRRGRIHPRLSRRAATPRDRARVPRIRRPHQRRHTPRYRCRACPPSPLR